jgi:hypothetical protein
VVIIDQARRVRAVPRHARRFRSAIRQPSDVVLSAQIGWFVLRCPGRLARRGLADFLGDLGRGHRPPASDVDEGRERIARLRAAWLDLPVLRRRNTCYVRALTLYRFLDAGGHDVGVHVGVERGRADRLHGHAWVTVDGRLLEGPPEVEAGSIVEVNLGGR